MLSIILAGSIHLTTTCLEHELKNALFERYDKEVRPVRNQSTVTVVKVHTEIYSILAIVSRMNDRYTHFSII